MVIWWDYSILYIIISGWWCNNNIEKYEFVNGKDYPIYEMEKNKSLKPPTRVSLDPLGDGFPMIYNVMVLDGTSSFCYGNNLAFSLMMLCSMIFPCLHFRRVHNYVYQRLCGNLLENAGDWRGPWLAGVHGVLWKWPSLKIGESSWLMG